MINDLSVVTDRLLMPQDGDEHEHEVTLVIFVKAKSIAWQGLVSYGF